MQVTYFLNGPKFNLLFYCNIILYWENVTYYEQFSHNLTLEVQILLRLWNKSFLTERCRNIQTFAFKVLQECSSLTSANGTVQIFFVTPNRKIFAGKFVKRERFLVVLREHIIFNVKWDEVRKMSEVVWAKLYCKMNDLFR